MITRAFVPGREGGLGDLRRGFTRRGLVTAMLAGHSFARRGLVTAMLAGHSFARRGLVTAMLVKGAERMRVVSLASSSSGNATLVEAGATAILLDAGLQGRVLTARLRAAGRDPATLAAILLTHEHSDHIAGALSLAEEHGIPLVADPRTLGALFASPARRFTQPGLTTDEPIQVRIDPHAVGDTWTLGELRVTSFAVPHDAAAPCGYLIGTGAWRLCLVTDCGAMTDTILAHLRQAHLIILEANHDRERLIRGPYPQRLKQRILGPTGHLANHEAAEALHLALDDGPRWAWLAHLSKINNTPLLAREAVAARLGSRRMRALTLTVAPPLAGPTWDSAALFSPA